MFHLFFEIIYLWIAFIYIFISLLLFIYPRVSQACMYNLPPGQHYRIHIYIYIYIYTKLYSTDSLLLHVHTYVSQPSFLYKSIPLHSPGASVSQSNLVQLFEHPEHVVRTPHLKHVVSEDGSTEGGAFIDESPNRGAIYS